MVGFLLGRWTPTQEVGRLKREIEQIQHDQKGRMPPDTAAAAARGFLQISEEEMQQTGRETPSPDDVVSLEGETSIPSPSPVQSPLADVTDGATNVPTSNFEADMERAKELWEVRSDLARNSFLQNVDANPQTAVRFDVLVEAMNIRIKDTVDQWVDRHREEELIRAEDGARLLHELTGAIVLTYDELDRSMPDTWREASGPEFKLFDFIDPGVAESLTEVEDRMQGFDP